MSEEPDTKSIYAGVGISICGNIMISLALNLQKYTHNKNDQAETSTHYLKRPLWWLGMILMLGGECGNFLAYAFAPASVVAPLGTVALVSNAIIAPFALKEKFRIQDFFGIVCAIGGAVVVVVFSASEQPVFDVVQLLNALKQTKFIIYMCATLVLLGVLLILSPKFGGKYLVVDMTIVGLFGGYTVISTKAISSLLTQGILKMFTYWIFYVMLFVLVVTGILQIRYLQKSLQAFDSTEVIPTQFVMFTVFAIIGGGVLYDDFSRMAPVNIFLFLTGISLTFVGVFLISKGRKKLKENDAENQGEALEAMEGLTTGEGTEGSSEPVAESEENPDAVSQALGKVFAPIQNLWERLSNSIAGRETRRAGDADEVYTSLGSKQKDQDLGDIANDEEIPENDDEEPRDDRVIEGQDSTL